jgi:hypothetical protein
VIYGDVNCQIKRGLTSHFIPQIESTASLATPLKFKVPTGLQKLQI